MADTLALPELEDGYDDWTFAQTFCRAFAAQVRPVTVRIADRIQAELPGFAVIDRAEYREAVHEHVLGLLESLATHTLPATILAAARAGGVRSAERGIPVESLLRSYHVGFQEIWKELRARILAEEPAQAARLPDLVGFIWTQLWAVTGASVEGHAEALRARTETRVALERQFLESLYGGRTTAESAALAARALDFHPEGTFQVICCPASLRAVQDFHRLKLRLRFNAGTAMAVVRETALVIVFQDTPADRILDLLSDGGGPVTAGIGLARPGLAGAADSVADAKQALAMARRQGGVVDFGSDWLAATLLPFRDRLAPLMNPERPVGQPHLRDAVRAYAGHGFSITAGAKALHIHPNTMKYRLDRWQQLTGWDPRTFDGLQRSLLSIAFSTQVLADQ
jgi:hypothetical protein